MNRNVWLVLVALAAGVLLLALLGRREPVPSQAGAALQPPASPSVSAPEKSAAAPRPAPPPQAVAPAHSAERPAPAPAPQALPVEPPVATPEAALQKLGRNSGLAFSAGAKVLSFGDGGVPDPTIGFYEWVVVSPTPLALPNGLQVGDPGVSNLPVAQAVQLVESKMGDTKVENPQTAFSLSWQKNGFAFSGTWVRAQGADYLIVQHTRN